MTRTEDIVVLDIAANGFLYHMVRNIAGSLLEVGKGTQPVGWLAELLHGRNRKLAGVTSPSAGLYFVGARYPKEFRIPEVLEAFPMAGQGQ